MRFDFDKRHPIRASAAQAWAVLADIRATAACWPDATLTTQTDSRRYEGALSTSIGAADALRLNGRIELLGMDATRRELRLRGEGSDAQGSSASVELTAHIGPGDGPNASVLVGRGSVDASGPLAERDPGLLSAAGDRLFAQFAERFSAAAAAVPPPGAASMKGSSSGKRGSKGAARASAGSDSTLTLMVQAGQEPGAAFAAKGANADPTFRRAASESPMGVWASLRRWLAGLFGR